MIYTCSVATPLGMMTAAAENEALTGLWFIGQKYYPAQVADWTPEPDYPVFAMLRLWLDRHFSGEMFQNGQPGLKLAPRGSEFQKAVWELLLEIPIGQVTTYGAMAKRLARARSLVSMSAQAVGGAVGHNSISILIPCHRVVGSNGSLTGYAGGLIKKAALLRLERLDDIQNS